MGEPRDHNEELLEMAEELEADRDELSEWEQDFITSVLKLLKAGEPLSPKQAEKLEEMHDDFMVNREFKDAGDDD